jgi:hypothetical protein
MNCLFFLLYNYNAIIFIADSLSTYYDVIALVNTQIEQMHACVASALVFE